MDYITIPIHNCVNPQCEKKFKKFYIVSDTEEERYLNDFSIPVMFFRDCECGYTTEVIYDPDDNTHN